MPIKQNGKYYYHKRRANKGYTQNITDTGKPENFPAQGKGSHTVYFFPVFFTHEAAALLFNPVAHLFLSWKNSPLIHRG
jgi:hypothetical protein